METRAGDPGAFARFDLSRVPSPAFVVDAAKVRANLALLRHIGDASGARALAALKAFSMWSLGPTLADHLDGVDGIHMHSLCEQDFPPLERTWNAVQPMLRPFFGQLKWLNFGGGHHVTRADYQVDDLIAFLKQVRAATDCDVMIEPGEAIALDAGILVGEVLDLFDNGMPIGITDISATCHMPDVIEAPYRPAMLGEGADGVPTRLGGPSCLAGDVIGDYRLPGGARIGQRFAFLDQAHYSMVKTNSFNGVPLPSIWLWDSESDELKLIREFGYEDFKTRLG